MGTITKTNMFSAIARLFSSEIDIENEEDVNLDQELLDVLKSLASKEAKVAQPINAADNKASKRGGFAKKISPNTEKAMRALHQQVQEKVEDRERY